MTAAITPGKRKTEGTEEGSQKKARTDWEGRSVSEGKAEDSATGIITQELLNKFHADFSGNPLNRIVRNALTHGSLHRFVFDRDAEMNVSHLFSHKIKTHPSASNQKYSGRCWMFAGLNCMRIAMIKKYGLPENFEFSQNYLFFYDQLEKANLFLHRMMEWGMRPIDDEDVVAVLEDPIDDGGYWSWFSDLVEKYGVIPKSAMPESHHSSDTTHVTNILNYQLRQFSLELRDLVAKEASEEEIAARKDEMMNIVYRILSDFLGEPPESFDWEYTTEKKSKYKKETNLTPAEFYEKWVPYNVEDKVLLFNLPVENKPYCQRFALWDKSMVGGSSDVFLNLPNDRIIPCLIESIKEGEPIYFYADVAKQLNSKHGALDFHSYDYASVFDTPFKMTKEERILTRESCATHAMLFCGVNLNHGKPNRWCVENSWGKSHGNQGYLTMSQEWFENYSFGYVVDRKYLPHELKVLSEQTPTQLSRKESELFAAKPE